MVWNEEMDGEWMWEEDEHIVEIRKITEEEYFN